MAVPPLHAAVPPLHAANHPSPLWQTCDYALRRMATTDSTGQKEIHTSPVLLLRKENLFRWAPALAVSYQTPLVPDPNIFCLILGLQKISFHLNAYSMSCQVSSASGVKGVQVRAYSKALHYLQ